jgi:two-component system sensor histidine kinase UhpB
MEQYGAVRDDAVRLKKVDGTVMDCLRTAIAIPDETGRIVAFQSVVRDVTEQKRAQQALKDSEEKYRSLFEQSMDAVCLVAVDGTLLDANPAYLRLYRLDGGAIGHSNSRERYVRAADREEFLRRMEQRGAVRDEEVQMKKADGTVMDCLRTAIAIRDKTGRIVAFQSVVRDITEQKRAQQELRSSEEKYRTLFEQSMDAVALVAADGTLLDANPAYLRLFGFDAGAIGHSNVQDRYVEAADRSRFLQWMEEHGAIHDEELRHRKVDGTVMDCLRSSVATRDETGRIVRFQTVVRDITEQKRAQQALKDSEEKFRSLFEQSMDAIVVSASDGSNMDANQAWLDLFGYTRDELPGLNAVVMYVDPKDRKDFLRKIAKTGVLVDEEVRLKKKDGSVMDCVRTVVAKKDSEGNVVAWQGVIHDITRRKRMEQQLVEANRELRDLTVRLEAAREEERAEVAWELHDHVAQTLSVLKLDLASCRSRLPEEVPAGLESKIDEMTQLLDETIERLRRLYADLVPVMLEDLGLAATIEWQAGEFARRSGVECEVRRVEDLPLPRGRVALGMYRVLQEALDNVRRHSGATRVTVDFTRERSHAVLRVADNGRGFTKYAMRKSGALGLAGVRERARSWGGRVTIKSSVGAGTVLKVTAPLEDEPAARTAPESPGI